MTAPQSNDPPVSYKTLDDLPGYRFGGDGTVWTRKQRGRWGVMLDHWRPLKLKPNPQTPYLYVILTNRDGKAVTIAVHVLICTAFHGPKPVGLEACHKDGHHRNNRADNLRWDTKAANMQDAIRHGTFRLGERHPNTKLSDAQVAELQALRASGGWTQRRLAAKFGVSQGHVKDILVGRRRKRVTGAEK